MDNILLKNGKTVSGTERLKGCERKKAINHLQRELYHLSVQVTLSPEAERLYKKAYQAYLKFKSSGLLSDALACARIRG